MSNKKVFDPDVESSRIMAAISYVWILFVIPLFFKRKSKFAQFHAKQGAVLFIAEIIVWLFIWIPLLGQIAFFAVILIAIIGFIKAYNGEWWQAPFIYKWSEKIKF